MDAVKAEKRRAVLRYRRLRRAAALSRCLLEALAAFSLLSWSSARLPAAHALCAGFRQLPAVILHPLFAFLVGNAIIVTLVAKSSEAGEAADDWAPPPRPSSSPPAQPGSSAVYDDDDHHQHRYYSHVSASLPQQPQRRMEDGEGVLYEDKAVCLETTAACYTTSSPKKGRPESGRFQRTRSWDVAGPVTKKGVEGKLLCRSVTDMGTLWPPKDDYEEDDGGCPEEAADDSDQFRRKIEAFIAKQQRFIEKEEESLLLASKAGGALHVASRFQRERNSRCR